jgi:pyridoxamine 5'-phosphate oxidase-like protein
MASRRDQIKMSDAELAAFLDEQKVMQCATVGASGRPHLVPLWYVPDTPLGTGTPLGTSTPLGTGSGELRGWTYAASQKAKNLERDPRATLGIDDGVEYQELRGVMFECDVEVEREPERVAEYGLELFARYGGGGDTDLGEEVRAMVAKQAAKRVGLRFKPTRTVTWDHRKLDGTY